MGALKLNTLFLFYKNLVYKNVQAEIGAKIKNILRTYPSLGSQKHVPKRKKNYFNNGRFSNKTLHWPLYCIHFNLYSYCWKIRLSHRISAVSCMNRVHKFWWRKLEMYIIFQFLPAWKHMNSTYLAKIGCHILRTC